MNKGMLLAYRSQLLIIALFLVALSIGGVNPSFALEDRYMYEVMAVNNKSKITTVFQVLAPTERDARENVAANGWTVLSLKQLTFKVLDDIPAINEPPIDMSEPSTPPANTDNATQPPATPRLTDNELIDSLLGPPGSPEDVNAQLVPGDGRGVPLQEDNDNLMLLPDSERLALLYTVYFNFGVITPILSAADMKSLNELPKGAVYYVFGHTDNVSVSKNAIYRDNYELSYMRAGEVKGILEKDGINPANINTVGLGATYPAVRNHVGAPGTLQNRRVEIYGLRKKE